MQFELVEISRTVRDCCSQPDEQIWARDRIQVNFCLGLWIRTKLIENNVKKKIKKLKKLKQKSLDWLQDDN